MHWLTKQARAASYANLGALVGVLWYKKESVWFGFSQDWSGGGVGDGAGVCWVVFMEELSVLEVMCVLGRMCVAGS